MYRHGTRTRAIPVTNSTPKPRLSAIGTSHCAWFERSRMIGIRPKNVVSEVRMTGRTRRVTPPITASRALLPSIRNWFTASISTRESLTTTPASATRPKMLRKLRS